MTAPYSGSCLCGAITYRVHGGLRDVIACHCHQCRKTSGNFVAASAALRSELEIVGAPVWFESSSTAKRGFCGTCGSNLFWDGGGDKISIFAGTLDGAPDIQLAAHIYCADKGSWYEINDDLPKADTVAPDWKKRHSS